MQIVYCTCNVSILESLQELLSKAKVESYQLIDRVLAHNAVGDSRFDTAVWPGYNIAIFVQCPTPEMAQSVMTAIKRFNQNAFNQNELILAYTWSVDDCCVG